MTAMDLSSIDIRYQKATDVLRLEKVAVLEEILEKQGIRKDEEGLRYLDSNIVSEKKLEEIFSTSLPNTGFFLVKAAVLYLKGIDPFVPPVKEDKEKEIREKDSGTDILLRYMQENKPVEQMSDKDLLNLWIEKREESMERELNKRAKGQPFIILKMKKTEPGKEIIDAEFSLEMLKSSKKRTNPSIVPYENNTFATVYKITELNIDDRLIEYCPFCGETLWKSYCSKCESNLSGIGDDERVFIKMVVDAKKINVRTMSDRKAAIVCALKGIEQLKESWPSLRDRFDEEKLLGTLPVLKTLANRPPNIKVDPFNISGNRTF
jgi:hypothetical protein